MMKRGFMTRELLHMLRISIFFLGLGVFFGILLRWVS
jgi:hypothetical protein